ncbi:hypothetical protein D3C75_767080 [compost metagenome]
MQLALHPLQIKPQPVQLGLGLLQLDFGHQPHIIIVAQLVVALLGILQGRFQLGNAVLQLLLAVLQILAGLHHLLLGAGDGQLCLFLLDLHVGGVDPEQGFSLFHPVSPLLQNFQYIPVHLGHNIHLDGGGNIRHLLNRLTDGFFLYRRYLNAFHLGFDGCRRLLRGLR